MIDAEPVLELRFLGTGPSGGRPGRGRSRRTESSLLVACGERRILIDVTRDFTEQARRASAIEVVLLTHGHRDACGGLPQLERWLRGRDAAPVAVLASPATVRSIRRRRHRLDHCRLVSVRPGRTERRAGWRLSALEVPHAGDCVTYAWKLENQATTLVYASDVARLTASLRRFSTGADLLVIDGAMWDRILYTHLTIQHVLPRLAAWPVRRLLFTQIGRSTPPHESLDRWLHDRCPRAGAAFDGLTLTG